MAKKPLSDLTDVELEESYRRFGKLVTDVRKESTANPGPGWEPVFDALEDSLQKFQEEVARRTQPCTGAKSGD